MARADTDSELFSRLSQEWGAISGSFDWDAQFSRMTDEWRAVEWRSGGDTLMAALGLQYQEVPLCRGLAWLLDPAGGHQLGRDFVEAFLHSLDVQVVDGATISVHVEESQVDTRADVIIRGGERPVIIEAKVFAGEQTAQADRIWAHWASENPILVFLTRTGHLPYTASKSRDEWVARTWRDVAQLARSVCDRNQLQPSDGAREFISTIGAL